MPTGDRVASLCVFGPVSGLLLLASWRAFADAGGNLLATPAAGTPQMAFYGFAVFYALCLILNWWFYLRKNAYVKNP